MVVGCGPSVVLEQRLCGIESRSVRVTRSMYVYLWILVRKRYKSRGCVIVNRGSCLVQEQRLYSSMFRYVRSTSAVAVRYIVVSAW
jgi:hypothetical protein